MIVHATNDHGSLKEQVDDDENYGYHQEPSDGNNDGYGNHDEDNNGDGGVKGSSHSDDDSDGGVKGNSKKDEDDTSDGGVNSSSNSEADSDDDSDYDSDEEWRTSNFKRTYSVYPLSHVDKTHLEAGNKIILPLLALKQLVDIGVGFPMQFKMENPSNGKISHCGVLEFSSEEGVAIMPEWMIKNMSLEEGGSISLENVTLDTATYVKLQPHSVDFLSIQSPKEVLEGAFSLGYSCLTIGDTILIMHEGKELFVDILDARPYNAVNMIEIDVEVDFAPPLDYKEPEKEKPIPKEEESPKFVPFSGRARRLDEATQGKTEAAAVENIATSEKKEKPNSEVMD